MYETSLPLRCQVCEPRQHVHPFTRGRSLAPHRHRIQVLSCERTLSLRNSPNSQRLNQLSD